MNLATLKIMDNDGFLALVNPKKYVSFYKEDWELKGLFDHFISQVNNASMVIWKSEGDDYVVDFNTEDSGKSAFRKFKSQIEVTDGKLYLTEYASLTMAASYSDSSIPSRHQSQLFIDLQNGMYDLVIKQLFETDSFDYPYDSQYEIIITKAQHKGDINVEGIQWYR